MLRRLLPTAVLLMGMTCGPAPSYHGDGQLSDRGRSVATDRYVLDLGTIKPGVSEYSIGALPSGDYVFGFLVVGLRPEEAQALVLQNRYELQMELNTDAVLVSSASYLPFGPETEVVFGNSLAQRKTYDAVTA
jgi:hypothetical protein